VKKLIAWVRAQRGSPNQRAGDDLGPRREFVYLDEVSVYSLLASRLGSIPEQLTKSASESLQSEINSAIGVNYGLKAEVGSKLATTSTSATQVVRKSMVQGAFKELVDIEHGKLALPDPPTGGKLPSATDLASLKALAEDPESSLVQAADQPARGQLLEIEVELDADPSFAFNTVVSEVVKFMDQNPEFFPAGLESIAAGETMNRIIAQLMVGLVPLRCRLLDYQALEVEETEFLVHRSLLSGRELPSGAQLRDVYLVGVAEEGLFWKDLRRVLFSRSRFTVMCRLGKAGLQSTWSPVKLIDVFKTVIPFIGAQLEEMIGGMISGFQSGAAQALEQPAVHEKMQAGMEHYARLYTAEFRQEPLSPVESAALVGPAASIDYGQLEHRRSALGELTLQLREILGSDEDRELEARLRNEAMDTAGFGLGGTDETPIPEAPPAVSAAERFLDVEFVAIYW
jgi:hypothetical protein